MSLSAEHCVQHIRRELPRDSGTCASLHVRLQRRLCGTFVWTVSQQLQTLYYVANVGLLSLSCMHTIGPHGNWDRVLDIVVIDSLSHRLEIISTLSTVLSVLSSQRCNNGALIISSPLCQIAAEWCPCHGRVSRLTRCTSVTTVNTSLLVLSCNMSCWFLHSFALNLLSYAAWNLYSSRWACLIQRINCDK